MDVAEIVAARKIVKTQKLVLVFGQIGLPFPVAGMWFREKLYLFS